MRIASRSSKLASVCAACLLHGAVVWGLAGRETIEMEGGPDRGEVAIGSSFADMAMGMMIASETQDMAERRESAEMADQPIIRETMPQAVPEPAPVFTPAAIVPPSESSLTEMRAVASMSVPVMAETPVAQAAMIPLSPQTSPQETLESQPDAPTAVARSLRPKTRSAAFETAHATPSEPARETPHMTRSSAAKSTPKGNARQNAKAGAAIGTSTATKAATSGSGQQAVTGNADVSNYPGKVMRKISRVPKPRVGQKGTAVVAFTIAPDGGLSTVSLARSSGSAPLDQAALSVIRKAAPFPPPPGGAQRSFSINIKGG